MKRIKSRFSTRAIMTVLFALVFMLALSGGTIFAVTLDGAPLFAAVGAQADVEPAGGGTYTITVNAHFESGVSSETQKVEYFADGATDSAADSGTIGDNQSKVFTIQESDTTPTLNLKSSASSRISSVTIKNSANNDQTYVKFGGQNYYNCFIESCKTSLFGYVELQSVGEDLTVDVTYDTPVTCADLGSYKNKKLYSVTVVAKGYVADNTMYRYVDFGKAGVTYDIDTNKVKNYNNDNSYSTTSAYVYSPALRFKDGSQMTVYLYDSNPQQITLNSNGYADYPSYIESIELYDNATGALLQNEFPAMGRRYESAPKVQYTIPDDVNRANITYVVTYRPLSYNPPQPSVSAHNVTVNGTYAADVAANTQTVGYFADTSVDTPSASQALANGGNAVFSVGTDTTPTLNLKSDSTVRISAVQVLDAQGNDITVYAFGAAKYYTDYIESCKTSRFGFLELQNITGDVTVNVTYDTPVTDSDLGVYNNNNSNKFYSVTVITKGDVGPYSKAYSTDYPYQDINWSTGYTVYDSGVNTATSGSGIAYNKTEGYHMRDGSQMTRYSYSSTFAVKLDNSNYSYIKSAKAYFNDTGEEVTADYYTANTSYSDLNGIVGKKITFSQSIQFNNRLRDNKRSVTLVITYEKLQKTTVYANLTKQHYCYGSQSSTNNHYRKISVGADENAKFVTSCSSASYDPSDPECDFNENTNPITSTSGGAASSRVAVIDSDTIKFSYDAESTNSIDFRNVKVYALDVNGNTFGEQLAGDGAATQQLTVTHPSARDSWDDDDYVIISGLSSYGGDIYVTADTYYYGQDVILRTSGEHTASCTVTADNAFGQISENNETADSKMHDSYTKPSTEGDSRHRVYSNTSYTVTSSGEQELQKVVITYRPRTANGTAGSQQSITVTTKNQDGSITFNYPTDNYYADSYSSSYTPNTIITVYFVPITTYEVQMYMTSGGVPVTSAYSNNNSHNSNDMVELSVYDSSGNPTALLFNTPSSGSATAYQTRSFNRITSTDNSGTVYKLQPGVKVKVKNIFKIENRAADSTHPQKLIDYVNSRMDFNGIEIYKASNFSHNSNATATLGDAVPFTTETVGDDTYYVFTMPESGVRIIPKYTDHVRAVAVLSSQKSGSYNYVPGASGSNRGTAALVGDDDNWFLNNGWYSMHDSYVSTSNANYSWAGNRMMTLDGSTFTLTATPADDYMVADIRAYKYPYTGNPQYNYVHYYNGTMTTCSWLSYNNGEITNTDITSSVISNLSAAGSNGVRTCTVTIPNGFDVGNIAIYVDFEPAQTITYKHFQYVKDTTSNAFNPSVTLKGTFGGSNAGQTQITATNGVDVETAIYDADGGYQLLTCELGGGSGNDSALYNRNLVYTLKNYETDAELLMFRIYRDQVLPMGSYTSTDLGNYFDLANCTFTPYSNASYPCETVSLKIKVPSSGAKLCHESQPLYIPVTIKQFTIDKNGTTSEAASTDFEVLTEKYYASSSLSDAARNRPFTSGASVSDPYTVDIATQANWTSSFTAQGTPTSRFMEVENSGSQGITITPQMLHLNSYIMADTPVTATGLNDRTGANGTNLTVTPNEDDGSYLISFTCNYNYSLSYCGGRRIEVCVYYQQTDDYYTNFSYQVDNSLSAFKPRTTLKGRIQGVASGSVEVTGAARTISTPAYDSTVENPYLLTVEIGGGTGSTDAPKSAFYQSNLIYTVKDYSNNAQLLQFRVYRDQIIPLAGYTASDIAEYIVSSGDGAYSFETVSGYEEVCSKLTMKFKVPQNGLILVCSPERTYIPITVNQYRLNSSGAAVQLTASDTGFETTVTKYNGGSSDDFAKHKFFYTAGVITDSYGLNSAEQTAFSDSYSMSGDADTHYMYLSESDSTGVYVMPNAPEGYTLAAVEGVALNKSGIKIENSTYRDSYVFTPGGYAAEKGYRVDCSKGTYLRGAGKLTVNIYYQPTTQFKVKQLMDGVLQSGTLGEVEFTNTAASLPAIPYYAYNNVTDNHSMTNTVKLTDSSANMTGTDEDNPGAHIRTTTILTNKGTKPQIAISPKLNRNIASVTLSKKVNGSYTELVKDTDYTVSGNTYNNGTYTITFTGAVSVGDDYYLEIVYGIEKTMTVEAVYIDNGHENIVDTEGEFTSTKATISVSGYMYDIDGTQVDTKPFTDRSTGSDVLTDNFTVTSAPKTMYNCSTNTHLTINTTIGSGSDYIIANIIAVNDAGKDQHLVTAGTKTYTDNENQGAATKTGYTYDEVTLDNLTSTDNVTVKVILAKVAPLKVSVFKVLDDGTTVENGTLQVPDSYVNVSVKSNGINQKAIITKDTEGGYYTGDFDITYNPHVREVSVVQGSILEIFAQLPENGTYVVQRIVSNGTGYQNVTVNKAGFDSNGNLRVTLNTNESINADNTYDLEIYIAKAGSVYTKTQTYVGDDEPYDDAHGTVTMKGTHSLAGAVPFTKIYQRSNSDASQNPNEYAAVTSHTYGRTTQAKCIRGTNISFDVKPNNNYGIKSVTVKKGTSEELATDIAFTASLPASDGTVTYTIGEPMPYQPNNIYVEVTFAILTGATVTVDFQYTDNTTTPDYKNMFDPTYGISCMSAHINRNSYHAQVAVDNVTGAQFFDEDGITYDSSTTTYTFYVPAGDNLTIRTTNPYKDGNWYFPVYHECYVENTATGNKIYSHSSSETTASISCTVSAGQNLTLHYRVAPVATIGDIVVNNNRYGDSPDPVYKEYRGNVTIEATEPSGMPYACHFNTSSSYWGNSGSIGLNGEAYDGATITEVTLDYKEYIKPGSLKNIVMKKFAKSDISLKSENKTEDYSDKTPVATYELGSYTVTDAGKYVFENLSIPIERDYDYRVFADYDLITVHNSIVDAAGYVKPYLYFTNTPDNINISTAAENVDYVALSCSDTHRFDESIKNHSSVYYVLVSDLPREDLTLTTARFADYTIMDNDGKLVDNNIIDRLTTSYCTRPHNGVTKYYYYYKIEPENITRSVTPPIDNSMRFQIWFKLRTEPNVVDENLDCNITVEQWNRDTYDGNYVAATGQSVRFSVAQDKVLKNAETNLDRNPIIINTATGYLYSHKHTELIIHPLPMEGYNVERVWISDSSSSNRMPDENGDVKHTLYTSSVTIKVYYSRPLLRISSTNEGNQAKATVDVLNNTTGETETILSGNTFTNGTFVTKNDDAQVIINPLTYTDAGTEYYYTVASIRIGNVYNNTLTAYTESGGDVANDNYDISKSADGSQYVLTLNDVVTDKYIFIQLVGKERIYLSNLQLNQQIKLIGSDEYVDCYEGNYGSVTVNGTLDGVENPMNFGSECSSYTLSDAASAEGSVRSDTALTFSAVPPDSEYMVKDIIVTINGEDISSSVKNSLSKGVYTVGLAPDSGTTVITVRYAIKTTPYTLTYNYNGRKGGNDGSYAGDDGESDPVTYTVNVELYPADITNDGKPTQRAIADHAPAVDDIYKDCRWTVTSADSDMVSYSKEQNEVTVNAVQTAKKYTVEFFYAAGSETADVVLDNVKLNSLATDNEGEFIQAPEKSGDDNFAYWSVLENGKEIARCYSRSFNLRVTGNYKIYAMYGARANVLSISDPRYTRQQYDLNGSKVDKLQVDFLLAYMESNGLLLNSELAAENGYKSGIVVEYFDDCVIHKDDITGGTLTEEDKASVTLPGVNEESVKAFIDSDSNSSANDVQHLLKYIVQNNKYNNKNRVDRVINFNNSEGARHMVFRAYYYVSHVDKNGQTVTELTDPVTFYLYDIGNSQSSTQEG